MAHITLPEFDDMTPKIQDLAKPILKKRGTLNETFRLLALREDIFFATDNMAQTYLLSETGLPFSTKERIALLVSMENSCKMCVNAHKSLAKRLGMSEEQIEQVAGGIDKIECEEGEKLLLKFCLRASQKDSYKILKSDIDAVKNAGYSDTQIFEAVAITSYFLYINTISNVFGLEDEA
ncbi:MAG: carboxymuconolactone decarboxylase family protein [Desulfobacterales bacterium]|nr:carboxymuconolactone decarboxylase family protein [Desulfobacterales bacterium]